MKPSGLPRKSACTCAYHRFLEGQMAGRKRARQHAKADLRAQVREAEAARMANAGRRVQHAKADLRAQVREAEAARMANAGRRV